jgi:transcriptional regulator GlxA family with amidase domain
MMTTHSFPTANDAFRAGAPVSDHVVVVLALDGVVLPDLAQPLGIFGTTPGYEVRICGFHRSVRTEFLELKLDWGLEQLEKADTVIVPGLEHFEGPFPHRVLHALRAAHAKGTRLVSICSGAFLLAEAGILEGLKATTHWQVAAELAARFPKVDVNPNVLFTDNGQVLCSAGATAGTDLCLHIVRKDLGVSAAVDAARIAVAPLAREGDQAQFIRSDEVEGSGRLDPLLDWMRANLHRQITVGDMALYAKMSERTINRRFREQTGTTPLTWLQNARIRRAQYLLEATSLSVEDIATRVGFVTASTLRQRFLRKIGVSPSAYRRTFRGRNVLQGRPKSKAA